MNVVITDEIAFRDARSSWWIALQIVVPSLSLVLAGATLFWQQLKDEREDAQRQKQYCLGVAQTGLQFLNSAGSRNGRNMAWERTVAVEPACSEFVSQFGADYVLKNSPDFSPEEVAVARITLKSAPAQSNPTHLGSGPVKLLA